MKTQISPSIQPSRGGGHKNLGSKLISPSPRQVLVEVAKLYVQYSITSMVQLVTFGILWVFHCSYAFQLVPCFKSSNSLIPKASKEASPSHLYAALSEVLETSSAAIKPIMPFSNVVSIIPRDAVSSFKVKPLQTAVSWREVLEQVQVKLGWEELNVTLSIVEEEELLRQKGPLTGDVAILVGIKGEEADLGGARLKRLEESVRGFKAIAPFDCSGSVLTMLAKGGIEVADESSPGISFGSADEMVFTILVLVNNFAKSIPKIARQLAPPTATLSQLACFGWNCYRDFTNCINNPLCKQTMTCMSQCK